MALHSGPNVTFIAALTTQGLEAVMELNEAVNAASFAVYLDQVLGPTMVAGEAIVLDKLRVYKIAGLAELVEARRARLLFLPPYSPDFTPVELVFSKLNTHLRTTAARTRRARTQALLTALNWTSPQDT